MVRRVCCVPNASLVESRKRQSTNVRWADDTHGNGNQSCVPLDTGREGGDRAVRSSSVRPVRPTRAHARSNCGQTHTQTHTHTHTQTHTQNYLIVWNWSKRPVIFYICAFLGELANTKVRAKLT